MIGNTNQTKIYINILCDVLRIKSFDRLPRYSEKLGYISLDDIVVDITYIVKNEFDYVKYACLTYHQSYLNRISRLEEVKMAIKKKIRY